MSGTSAAAASNSTPDRRLKIDTLAELLARAIPKREFLVEPWLKTGESALVYSQPGTGKSMLTLTLALAVAGGGEFLGWRAPRPRRVMLFDGEMATADLQERAAVLLETVQGIDREAAGANLTILARQRQHPEADFPDLADPEAQKQVLRMVRRRHVDLLILDNLSTLAQIEDENAASAFNQPQQFLMRLKQAGVACVLVHHSGKSGETYRGSSRIATTFEVLLGLSKSPDTQDTKGTAFEITWPKYRGKRRDDVTTPRKVHLEETPEGHRWKAEKSAAAEVQELVAAVQSGKFRSQNELAKHLGVDPATISRRKSQAIHVHNLITEAAWKALLTAPVGDPESDMGASEF